MLRGSGLRVESCGKASRFKGFRAGSRMQVPTAQNPKGDWDWEVQHLCLGLRASQSIVGSHVCVEFEFEVCLGL